MRLLVTRPEGDAERTAAILRARSHDVIVAALLRIETLAPMLSRGPWRALALTSANAARAIERHPRRAELIALPVFVVGRRTGAAARAVGFSVVHSAEGNADDLTRLIAARVGGGALLYLAGEDRAADLSAGLAHYGVTVETAVVYRATKASDFPPAAAAALAGGGLDGVLHYSRRSAQAYLDCANASGLHAQALSPVHFCLSQAVAVPLVAAGAAAVRVAAQPHEEALLDLLAAP